MFLKFATSTQSEADGPFRLTEVNFYEGKRIFARVVGRGDGPVGPHVNHWEIVVEDDQGRVALNPEPGRAFYILNDKGRTIDSFA